MGGSGSGPRFGSQYRSTGASDHLDLTVLRAKGYLQPGQCAVAQWGWWDENPKKLRSAVNLELDLRDSPRYRIWYGVTAPDRPPSEKEISGALFQTYPFFGGVRWWFQCPGPCGRRCRVLYRTPYSDSFACRRCHQLRYLTQRETRHSRLLRKRFRLADRLGNPDGSSRRPRGMHRLTFRRLQREAEALDRAAFRELVARMPARFAANIFGR